MAKIETSELHKTPGGSIGFLRQLQLASQCARENIAELKESRKKDMAASGSIHGLALLAKEAPSRSLPVSKKESDEWREIFFAWFNRVKRYFPESVRSDYCKRAEEDFDLIRDRSNPASLVDYPQIMNRFDRTIRFHHRDAYELACEEAKKKYPVELGIALDEYLKACVRRLVSDDDIDTPLVVKVQKERPKAHIGTTAVQFIGFDDGEHSVTVTSFEGFGAAAGSGFGLQQMVQQYLKKHYKDSLKHLEFDSESSMFCVRSTCVTSLSKVAEVVFTLAADAALRKKTRDLS